MNVFRIILGRKFFFNQLPTFRYLAHHGHELIGQLGVEYRVISNGGKSCKVLCVSDVCVSEAYRSRKIASRMLKKMEVDAKKAGIDCHTGFEIVVSYVSLFYVSLCARR